VKFNDQLLTDSTKLRSDSVSAGVRILDELREEKIRLSRVRKQWYVGQLTHTQLESKLVKWMNYHEYLLLYYRNLDKIVALKCAKRGNDVYLSRINTRFAEIDSLAGDFPDDLFDPKDKNKKTNVVFVTLTYDTKHCSLDSAWHNIGVEWNRYQSNLKRKFGRLSFVRAFESFDNYYPHIHAVMVFPDKKFNVFKHISRKNPDGRPTFRIQERDQFKSWHSKIDVTAVGNTGQAIKYITKYLRKSHDPSDSKFLKTQSMLWIYNKRSFSISKDYVKRIREVREVNRLESVLHNSNNNKSPLANLHQLIKDDVVCLGIFSGPEIAYCNDEPDPMLWAFRIKNIPERKPTSLEKSIAFDERVPRGLYYANKGVSS